MGSIIYTRFTDKRKIKEALEVELGMKPQKKGRYTFFSLHLAELDESHYPSRNNANNVHYVFPREEYKTGSWKSTNGTIEKVEQNANYSDFATQLEQEWKDLLRAYREHSHYALRREQASIFQGLETDFSAA